LYGRFRSASLSEQGQRSIACGRRPVHGDRRRPSVIGPHPEEGAIGEDFDVALQVGPEDRDPRARRERREGLRRRVSVLVTHPRGDDRDRWMDGVDESRRGRRVRPMVADLQHVDRLEHAAGCQDRLDRRFGIAGQ
jgi:hypothetical protein